MATQKAPMCTRCNKRMNFNRKILMWECQWCYRVDPKTKAPNR
jgi:hypothetical protein